MARLLGHTLGTPHHSLMEALDLFAQAGLDGAEIIWQNDYRAAIPEDDDGSVVAAVIERAHSHGLTIGCLTPYTTELNNLDADTRERDVRRLKSCIQTARVLDCPRIRVYGGSLLDHDHPEEVAQKWSYMVQSLRELGSYAADHGTVLCIENHFGTMSMSAADTVRLVTDVGSAGVGILYDQANLTFTHSEGPDEAIALQAPWIRHVHVKDLEFIDEHKQLRTAAVSNIAKDERVHRSRMIGDGILDWEAIVGRLVAAGYDGSYSLEYEYRWNPEDLPDPAIGIPESARRLRQVLARASGAGTAAARPESLPVIEGIAAASPHQRT